MYCMKAIQKQKKKEEENTLKVACRIVDRISFEIFVLHKKLAKSVNFDKHDLTALSQIFSCKYHKEHKQDKEHK